MKPLEICVPNNARALYAHLAKCWCGCAAWAFQASRPLWGVTGIVTGIVVIVYGIYFLKKLKNVSYL